MAFDFFELMSLFLSHDLAYLHNDKHRLLETFVLTSHLPESYPTLPIKAVFAVRSFFKDWPLSDLNSTGLLVWATRVVGMGDCHFRSMSHQMVNTEDYHPLFRAVTVDYMRRHRRSFERAFDEEFQNVFPSKDYDAYCDEVAKLKMPVGEIPILASCEAFGVKFIRVFSYGSRAVSVLVPRDREFTKVIFISSIYGHADSIFPIGSKVLIL